MIALRQVYGSESKIEISRRKAVLRRKLDEFGFVNLNGPAYQILKERFAFAKNMPPGHIISHFISEKIYGHDPAFYGAERLPKHRLTTGESDSEQPWVDRLPKPDANAAPAPTQTPPPTPAQPNNADEETDMEAPAVTVRWGTNVAVSDSEDEYEPTATRAPLFLT